MVKAKLPTFCGLVTAKGAAPPPTKPKTKDVPALVASISASTTPLSESSAARTGGTFKRSSASASCSARPETTVRRGKARRFSLMAQAAAMMTTRPSPACR